MLKALLLTAAIAYGLICLVLFIKQRTLLYFPTLPSTSEQAQAWFVDINGLRQKVWRINPGQRVAILYFGGNAEDVAQNIAAYKQAFPKHSIYLTNYRGYGGSEGRPSEAALLADALALFDQLQPLHSEVVLIGRSLGSGVAMHVAEHKAVQRQVLITPYDSVLAVAKQRFFWLPVGWLLRDRFDSVSRAADIGATTLVLAAEHDTVVPLTHARALVAALPSQQTELVVFDATDHNSIDAHPDYIPRLQAFVD